MRAFALVLSLTLLAALLPALSTARSATFGAVTEDDLSELGDEALDEIERFVREMNSTSENSTEPASTEHTTQTPVTVTPVTITDPTPTECPPDTTPETTTGEGECSCETGSSTAGLDDEVVIEEEVEYTLSFIVDNTEVSDTTALSTNCSKPCKVKCTYKSLPDGRVIMTCTASDGGTINFVTYTVTGKGSVTVNVVNGQFTIPHANIPFHISKAVFHFHVTCSGQAVFRKKTYLVAKGYVRKRSFFDWFFG